MMGRLYNNKPVVIEHVIYPRTSQNGPVVLDDIVRKIRNSMKNRRNWLIDPNNFALSQGKLTSTAISLQSFLAKDIPPFDADATKLGGYWWQITSNITCPRLLVNENVQVFPTDCTLNDAYPVNQTCRMFCRNGFSLVGDEYTVCLPNGLWSGSQAKCVKFCSTLPEIDKARLMPYACERLNASVISNTRCIHYCEKGFRLFGSFHRKCQVDGSWENTEPVCRIQCPTLTPPRYGKMTPSRCATEMSIEGDVCAFSCSNGFILQGESTTTCDSNGR